MNDGNWTENSAIFTLKSNLWFQNQMWVRCENTRMISDENCMSQSPITSILKLQHSIVQILGFLVCKSILLIQYFAGLSKVAKVINHFPTIWLVILNKPWNVIGCWILVKLSHWPGRNAIWDLEKWCDSWVNCTIKSQSDCKDHQ